MAVIFQTTFSNVFSLMKMNEFRLRFHWSLFPRVKSTMFHHWFRQWLGAGQATSHYLKQWWLVYWRIYASLGLNEFKPPSAKWWPFCSGPNELTGGFPSQRARDAEVWWFLCCQPKSCRIAGDFRRHGVHVTSMLCEKSTPDTLNYSNATLELWHLRSPATGLLVRLLVQSDNRENIKAPHYRRPVGPLHWGPVMRKAFPYKYIIMLMDFRLFVWCQAIIWTNADLLPRKFRLDLITFIQQN